MLFSIDNDYIFNDYFNMPNKKDGVLSPKEGQKLGNMFVDEYVPYKNYVPKDTEVKTEKERDLQKIRELAFAVNDLNLALDVDPSNKKLYSLFKMYAEELDEKCKNYSKKYDVLEVIDDVKGTYTWYKNPWPWESDRYV